MVSSTPTEPPDRAVLDPIDAAAHTDAAAVMPASRMAQDAAEAGAAAAVADRLADVAHEMRGPLGAVIALGDLLLARDLDAGDRRVVELIRLAGRHLLGLADDLAGPGAASGRGTPTGADETQAEQQRRKQGPQRALPQRALPQRALPADMARSVAALYAPLLGAAGLHVAVEVAREVPQSVPANETWLRQILVNFVSNALKFAATEVRVVVAVDGADVVFTVEDDGPGPDAAGTMPGARPDPVTGRAGSGRGLQIAGRLAAALGGTIALAERPGGGTAASLRLPAHEAETPATDGPALAIDTGPDVAPRNRRESGVDHDPLADDGPDRDPLQAAAGRARAGRRRLSVRRRIRRRVRASADTSVVSLEGMAVLVVDDSLVSRLLMLTILESFDMRVVAVTSGAEAEAEVRRRRPDLVCLDWTLDGETGESVRRRLEEVLGPAMPPAIAITGLATAPRLPEAGWQGGPVVAKPFSPRELHLAIEEALAPRGRARAPGHGHPS